MFHDEWYSQRSGTGGANLGWEVLTRGRIRLRVRADGSVEYYPVLTTPDAPTELGTGVFFFRNDGAGKSQLCCRFPSGATQILATEP